MMLVQITKSATECAVRGYKIAIKPSGDFGIRWLVGNRMAV